MGHILNIAHRGFTRKFPDNTLEAFQAAIEIGADGIEFDVQETADHRFVIFHDQMLLGSEIGKLSLAQINDVKLGKRYRIPTLEETLDLCRKRVRLVIELKQVWSLDGFLSLLRARAELNEVIIASFNQDLISKLSYLAPEVRRGILTGHPVEDPIKIIQQTRADLIIMRLPFTTSKQVDIIHTSNLRIFVWDCAGLRDVKNALRLEADGIISDSPDLVIKQRPFRN